MEKASQRYWTEAASRKVLLTCGPESVFVAAFHAPLAGVMFSQEAVHKNFSCIYVVSVMTASISADFLSSNILGSNPFFSLTLVSFPILITDDCCS